LFLKSSVILARAHDLRLRAGSAAYLIRIDPARNMRRFCSLNVQPDLFGGFAIVKELVRIGSRGRMMGELHQTEVRAAAAMQRQVERKRRREYVPGVAIRG